MPHPPPLGDSAGQPGRSNRVLGRRGCHLPILPQQDGPAAPLPASPGDAKLQRAKEALRLAGHPGDPQSLEAVGLMLDKLAKENQDIRLMQAELRVILILPFLSLAPQAQKEELETLLRKSEENARLTEALQRETASLQAAQTELRLLREKLQGLGEAGLQRHRRVCPAGGAGTGPQGQVPAHYEGLAAALSTFFGSNGTFAHDRLSFVDFLDEVEDALEELAELLGVSKEDVDNFEEMALTQLEAAPWGR
uniref:Uncharacterized protein n=1 Tax=Varanus komodoensis TaxID=61221 RepID=A0A8D2KX33_VARKO